MTVIAGASLAASPGGRSQDRWTRFDEGAIVLDGASSFVPAAADAEEYVDALLNELSTTLQPETTLPEALAGAIERTSDRLGLTAGRTPSSTVLIARENTHHTEFLALGDSVAIVHTGPDNLHRVTDDRISLVAADVRAAYKRRLRDRGKYTDEHHELLRRLQLTELAVRNTDQGYWIAEADSCAAYRSVTRTFNRKDVTWWILATDGAERIIDHLGIPWRQIGTMSSNEIERLLFELYKWERDKDPHGELLPRAKPHDDKTLVIGRPRN